MAEQATKSAATEECSMGGDPTTEHARLEPFVGTFKAHVTMWMGGPGEKMESTGMMKNEFILGGRFLQQSYQGDASEGPFPNFEGHGLWGYNTTDKRYEGVWTDTASTVMQLDRGQVDGAGKVWKMLGEMTDPRSGQSLKKTSVITLKDTDHHQMEMFFETPQGSMKGMEIQYTRVG